MSDVFMSALLGADKVKASARIKMGNQTRTVTLLTKPSGIGDDDFMAAAKDGVDLSVSVKGENERSRVINGKGVHGAAAVSATGSVLGFTAPAGSAPKPNKAKHSTNGVHPEPAAVTAGMSSEGGSGSRI